MDAIRPWLYIGKYMETLDAELLSECHIRAKLHLIDPMSMLSAQKLAEANSSPDMTSLYLSVEDGKPLPPQVLQQGVEFVCHEKYQGKIVLIACGAGISRSAAFAIAVLKEVEGVSLLEAAQIVKRCHPRTRPHSALWNSLCQYYHERISADHMLHVLRDLDKLTQ
jgi:hypothetical protein